jgi:hypothetical protein
MEVALSKKVEMKDGYDGLSKDELQYLADRDRLPAAVAKEKNITVQGANPTALADVPNVGDVNTVSDDTPFGNVGSPAPNPASASSSQQGAPTLQQEMENGEDPVVDPLMEKKNDELVAMLEKAQLPTFGNKSDLVQRIKDNREKVEAANE